MATATEQVLKPDHSSRQRHFIFTDEHEDLRESMRSWVQKELAPHRMEWEETLWPDWVLHRGAELGYVGLCFPEEYGGQGGDYFYSLVRADCMSYSSSSGATSSLGSRERRSPAWESPSRRRARTSLRSAPPRSATATST